MDIRPATPSDVDAIARVHALATTDAGFYESALDVDREVERMRPRIDGYLRGTYHPSHALAPRAVFVAEVDRDVVGYIAGHATTRLGCSGELQWMFVRPGAQRRGIGSALLSPLRTWFVENDCTRVIVDALPENPARAFYIRHGAEPLDEHWLYWADIGAG